jgi:hypothetical protein
MEFARENGSWGPVLRGAISPEPDMSARLGD